MRKHFLMVVTVIFSINLFCAKPQKEYPLYATFMLHIQMNERQGEEYFRGEAANLRRLADIFKNNGATISMHSEPPFAAATRTYNDNVLLEMEEKYGFPVGMYLHGGGRTMEHATSVVDSCGVSNRHVSAHWPLPDWVEQTESNGYEYVLGPIGMLDSLRNNPANHESWPMDIRKRIHPWRLKTSNKATNTIDDPEGKVVVIPGDSGGEIQKMGEKHATGKLYTEIGRVPIEWNDFEAAKASLEEYLQYVDPNKINCWYVCINLNQIGRAENTDEVFEMYDRWLKEISDEYVSTGKVVWKTSHEMYDEYMAWLEE